MIKRSGKLGQQVSDFMDGELDQEAGDCFLNMSKQQPECHRTWQRYHLIGDAIRNQLPESLDIDLSQRIRQSLEKEPTIFAPDSAKPNSLPVPTDQEQAARTIASGQRKAYRIGLAMAATVAFAAVLGVQMMPLNQPQTSPVPLASIKSQTTPPGVSVVSAPLSHPAEFNKSSPVEVESFASLGEWKRLEQSPVLQAPQTQPFMISHQGQLLVVRPDRSPQATVNAPARVVDFEPSQR